MSGSYSEKLPYNSRARKWDIIGLDSKSTGRITQYKEKYDRYLKAHNNTSTKEVWKIYDHIASELMREALNDALHTIVTKDVEDYVEQVIVDEF